MTTATTLTGVVGDHIAAVNALDEEAIVATFADDALVNDARREFWGMEAIRGWVAKEMVGDKVTIDVTEVLDHRGEMIVRGRYDGEFDRSNLPDELILTHDLGKRLWAQPVGERARGAFLQAGGFEQRRH